MSNKNYKYDFLIVGAGPFGCTCARLLTDKGYKCLVMDKNSQVGGLAATVNHNDIDIHLYGAHIFHTDNKYVWDFVNKYSEFYHYKHNVCAFIDQEIYQLPFNMNTLNKVFKTYLPIEAYKKVSYEISEYKKANPDIYNNNLETEGNYKFGPTLYNKFIKNYSEKLWGTEAKNINKVPISNFNITFDYNNDYFQTKYQGVPVDGYTKFFENMLGDDIDVMLNKNFMSNKDKYLNIAKTILYTGAIDAFCDYKFGELPWRTLHFEINNESSTTNNLFGIPQLNIPDPDNILLNVVEHKWLNPQRDTDEFNKSTWVSYVYLDGWKPGKEELYPINTEYSEELYNKYNEYCREKYPNVIFCGRRGLYRLINMDQSIQLAMELCHIIDDTL